MYHRCYRLHYLWLIQTFVDHSPKFSQGYFTPVTCAINRNTSKFYRIRTQNLILLYVYELKSD